MAASTSTSTSNIYPSYSVLLLVIIILVVVMAQLSSSENRMVFGPGEEIQRLRSIRNHLKKINKSPMVTIHSLDGDVIDCVPCHEQPAFDHPRLKGQKPLDPPERPRGGEGKKRGFLEEGMMSIQLWQIGGEECEEGTIPIRRTTEKDMLRVRSVGRFGRKKPGRFVRKDTSGSEHEHAVGYVSGDQYYGAKASINVWAPKVANSYEFSLSQMWVISGSFGDDLNTIEAGWQAWQPHC